MSYRRFVAIALVATACRGDSPVPSSAVASTSAALTATVAAAVPTIPTIRVTDAKGKGVKNVLVQWRVTSGGGRVVNDSARTTSNGEASAGGWALGTGAGIQTLQATAEALPPVVFTARATAGQVARLVPTAGNEQTGVVGTVIATSPVVRAEDQFGNPVSNVPLSFSITQGNGVLNGAQQTSDELGFARLGSWTLGTVSGRQTVVATGPLSTTASFSVTALPGPATDILKLVGDNEAGVANTNVSTPPGVRIVDGFGNPVGNVPVTFLPGPNSGTVTGGTVVSDPATGTAFVGSWRLSAESTQILRVTSSVIPNRVVTFTSSVTISQFNIDIRFIGDASLAVRSAFANAAARWRQIIVGSIGSVNVNIPANDCAPWTPAVTGTVQNLVIFARIDSIDGPGSVAEGNILGQASPCYVNPSAIPFLGFMEFDRFDVDQLVSAGQFEKIVLHEIGHVLGIGTIWNFRRTLLNTSVAADPFFTGSAARTQFSASNTLTFAGNAVPVENTGGAGTANVHWRTSVMQRELMQGFAVGGAQPLSRITAGSLQDLGYLVNIAAADPFSLAAAMRPGFDVPQPSGIPMRDLVPPVIIKQRRADGSIAPFQSATNHQPPSR